MNQTKEKAPKTAATVNGAKNKNKNINNNKNCNTYSRKNQAPTLQSLVETIRDRSYYDYPQGYQNHLAVCKYPNLAAEIEATWYSLSTVASWMKCSIPALVSVLEDGKDLLFPDALSLGDLFRSHSDYLFSGKLELCHVDRGDGTEEIMTFARYRQEIYQAQALLGEEDQTKDEAVKVLEVPHG